MPFRPTCGLLTLLSFQTLALAQLPSAALDFIYPAGGQAGTQFIVQTGGRDLDEARRLVFSHPGITGQVVMRAAGEFETEPQPVDGQFEVHIALNVPPGTYDARVVGRFGISTPRSFVVGNVQELQKSGEHHTFDAASPLPLDVVMNGRTDGGAVDYYRFSAQQGQKLVIECGEQEIESNLKPIITIWDSERQQLARSKHLHAPLVEFVAPATGDYVLGVNDHVFGGGAAYAYRLRIHAGPYLIAVAPAAALPGTNATLTIYGRHLPAGEQSNLHLDGSPLERQEVALFIPPSGDAPPAVLEPVTAAPDGFVFRWPTPEGTSNGVVVAYAEHPVIGEVEDNDTPETAQVIRIPCDYCGRFYPRRDQDWVQFTAVKGQAYQVRVVSHRLGHPTDPELFVQKIVRKDDGTIDVSQVSTEDDFQSDRERYRQALRPGLELSHRDPVVRFTADQDGDYRVGLRDLNGSSIDDPRFTYRLVIEPQSANFELLVWAQQQATDDDKKIDRGPMTLRRASTLPILVDVLRQGGFDQEVRVHVRQLPEGVTANECRIAAGQTQGVLMLCASDDAAGWCGPIEIAGEAQIGGQTIEQLAREAVLTGSTGNVEQNRPSARLARQVCLSVVDQETGPAQLEVARGEAPESLQWQTSLGAKLTIPLSYIKHAELKSELGLQPIGLPNKVQVEGLTLAPDASQAQLQLTLNNSEITPGTYPVFLRGKVKANYARNPQAIAAAQKRRNDFDRVLATLDEQDKQTAADLAESQQTASQLAEQMKQLEVAHQAVRESLELASQQVQEAMGRTTGLQQGANSAQGAQAATIQQLIDDVRAATQEASLQVQKARSALNLVEDSFADVRSQRKAAQDEVTQAEARRKLVLEKKERASSYVKQLDQQLAETQKNLGPTEVTSYVDSPVILLEILRSPLTASAPTEPLKLKRGETREVAIEIQRRFGFGEAVTMSLKVPEGVSDIAAEPRRIERHRSNGALQITAGPNAPSGQQTLDVELNLRFNGVDLQERVPLQLVVED